MKSDANRELPRRFHLLRIEDVHGVSGDGIVAEGVQFTNGYVVLTWLTQLTSVAVYHSVDVLERIHGHEGRSIVVWDDPAHELSGDRGVDSHAIRTDSALPPAPKKRAPRKKT